VVIGVFGAVRLMIRRGKLEKLGEKSSLMIFRPPQILYAVTRRDKFEGIIKPTI
jgi:hypothetical protein